MAEIHLQRQHNLGIDGARQLAHQWAEQAQTSFDMVCTHAECADRDEVHFTRSGVRGTLKVFADRFELDAHLGFLLGAFKERIESEITLNLNRLLESRSQA